MKYIKFWLLLVIIGLSTFAMAQQNITGTVTDTKGESIPGVSIIVKGTTVGTVSNANGEYSITVPENGTTLAFYFVGMATKEVMIANQSIINVVLESESVEVEEVVATGYRTLPKARATGSYATVTSRDLEQVLSPNLMDKLEGQLSGLEVRDGQMIIRGQNTFNTGDEAITGSSTGEANPRGVKLADGSEIQYRGNPSAPLVVLDGFPYEGSLNDIDPNDVESINILKDAASASIWGVRASNGVIVITRKKAQADGDVNIRFDAYTQITDQPNFGDYNYAPGYVAFDAEKYALDSLARSSDLATNYRGTTELENIYYKRDVSKEITWPQAERMIAELRSRSNYGQIQDEFFRKSVNQNYNFQLTHTAGRLENILSLRYMDNKTSYVGNKNNKINMSLRTNYNLAEWLRLSFNYTSTLKNSQNNSMANSFAPNITGARVVNGGSFRPYEMLTNANGNYNPMYNLGTVANHIANQHVPLGYLPWHWNALEEQNNNDNTSQQRIDILQMAANLKLPFGFSYSTQIQYQYGRSDKELFYGRNSFLTRNLINTYTQYETVAGIPVLTNYFPTGGGTRQLTQSLTTNLSYRNQLNFDKVLNEVHFFTASIGTDLGINDTEFNTETNFGYNTVSGDNGTRNLNLRDLILDGNTLSSNYTYNGIPYPLRDFRSSVGFRKNRDYSNWGMIGYVYDERYNLSLSGRRDKSNLLGADESNFLWSTGASWTISNESFFEGLSSTIKHAKLRTSYGYTGNVDRSAIPFLRGTPVLDSYTGLRLLAVNEPSNPHLKPERTRNINVGLDISLANNFMQLTVDYYNNLSTNLIVKQKTDPTYKGFMTGSVNNGTILNEGVDFKFDVYPVKTKNFRWKSTLNFAYNKNFVEKYVVDDTPNYYRSLIDGSLKAPGYALDPIFSYDYQELDNQGNPQIKIDGETVQTDLQDEDGNNQYGYNLIGMDDLVYGGGLAPKYHGGFFNTFMYKGFSFMFSFNYKLGHYMRMPVPNLRADAFDTRVPLKDIVDRWQKPGDENHTSMPRMFGNSTSTDPEYTAFQALYNHEDWYRYASTNVEKADFVRLKYLNLSYQLPRYWVQKVRMKSLRLSLQVDNIWYWSANSKGIDPEFVNRPNPRTYNIGIYTTF